MLTSGHALRGFKLSAESRSAFEAMPRIIQPGPVEKAQRRVWIELKARGHKQLVEEPLSKSFINY